MSTPTDQGVPKGRLAGLSTDRLLAFSAVFLSLAALVVSIFQTAILREQQRASVWPHLQVYRATVDSNYSLKLVNNGVGPAVIRTYAVHCEGERFEQVSSLSRRVIRDLGAWDSLGRFGYYYSDVDIGEVIQAGQEVDLLTALSSIPLQAALDSVFDPAHTELHIRYADVYGNEWQLAGKEVTER